MHAAFCGIEAEKDGCRICASMKAMCVSSIHQPGPDGWIRSQRASLARIFLRQAAAPVSPASAAGSSGRSSTRSTPSSPVSSSSRTVRESVPGAEAKSFPHSWRVDTPGATESLPRLMSAPAISVTDGGSLLPTLTVCGNWNRRGASAKSGDGLETALKGLGPTLLAGSSKQSGNYKRGNPTLRGWMRLLPTICATDYKSPYSAEGFKKQTQQRSKPLRDTLVHTTGHRLTPAFAEWWMGWPIGWTASSAPATGKSRFRPQRRG